MTETIAVIPGDGIGKSVVPAAVRVLDSLDLGLSFVMADAGDETRADTGTPLPDRTIETVESADATLFGAAGETAADVILPLRSVVGSYANIRPARTYPGVAAVAPDTDLIFVRENTEGVYAGIESSIEPGITTLTRVVTEDASRAIAEMAVEYATDRDSSLTIAHKANVMRTTDGLFLDTATAVANEHGIDYDTALMDALAMQLVMEPEAYDVVVCPNLAGDLLSDLAAGLVGGLGLLPSANIGGDNALFEPVHGTAPDIAGEGIANPTATILSSAMLLEYLGYDQAGRQVRAAVEASLENGPKTPDLGGNGSTEDVTSAVIDRL